MIRRSPLFIALCFCAFGVSPVQSSQVIKNDEVEINPQRFYIMYPAPDGNQVFDSYESQFQTWISTAVNKANVNESFISNPLNGALISALSVMEDDFEKHKMLLKNVVHRSDTGFTRITFADKDDHYVVKGTYGVSSDDVLTNSKFADKNKLLDLKIMFIGKDGKYQYAHIGRANTPVIKDVPPIMVFQGTVTNETCKYCHMLAQHSGSPSGLFFKRYQDGVDLSPLKMGNVLSSSSFTPTSSLPSWAPSSLNGQRVMVDYQSTGKAAWDIQNFYFETPELLETLARDNKASYCVAINPNPREGLSYVCADVKSRKLYVNASIPMPQLHGQVENKRVNYTRDFYKDTDAIDAYAKSQIGK